MGSSTIKIGFLIVLLLVILALVAGFLLSGGELRFAYGNSPQALAEAELIRVEADLARDLASSQVKIAEAEAASQIALAQELESHAPQLAAQRASEQIWKSRVFVAILVILVSAVAVAVGYTVWYFRLYVPAAAKAAGDREALKPAVAQIGQFVAFIWPAATGLKPTIVHQRSPGTGLTPSDLPGIPLQVDPQTAQALGYATSEADAAAANRGSVSGDLVSVFSRQRRSAVPRDDRPHSLTVIDQ